MIDLIGCLALGILMLILMAAAICAVSDMVEFTIYEMKSRLKDIQKKAKNRDKKSVSDAQ